MNLSLLKKLLPGLIPLLIFIIADGIWGTKIGLYVALGTGVAEFMFYFIRDKVIDKFILLDTGLLLLMGVISIALENDIFFKIKPALIEAILIVIIAFSLWGPKNLIMAMSQRYMGELRFNGEQLKAMRQNMLGMFWITGVHIILVLISAFYMSKEAWFFISGVLFYILFAAFFGLIWIKNFLQNRRLKKEEWFPVVDNEGAIIGKAPRSVCHNGISMYLHPVVHLHLFNSSGRLFLQKRVMTKDIQPGKWDTSVGGHVSPGETIEKALIREAGEELGLKNFEAQFSVKYIWESTRERELVYSFSTISDQPVIINKEEIEEGRYWLLDEIKQAFGKDIFTPNFEHEFRILLSSPGFFTPHYTPPAKSKKIKKR
jgi:isopentenyldiphosphate isomerase/intracellular septation protein A